MSLPTQYDDIAEQYKRSKQVPWRYHIEQHSLFDLLGDVLMMPWKLLSDANAYIFGWLVGYSSLLGPIAGIMIADYFVLRKCRLDAGALYSREGPYAYANGVNWRGVAALAAGVAAALLGLGIPPLRWLYDYAWFVGFGVSAVAYLALMRGRIGDV